MKKIISTLMVLVMLTSALLAFSSCTKDDDGAQISVYLTDRVYSFDPAASVYDDATLSIISLIFEPLFTLNKNGNIKKAMADKYEWNHETGDLTILLKESYWSDGSRVCAADFVYAWKRIIDPANSFSCASLLFDIKNAVLINSGAEGYDSSCLGVYADDTDILRISFENTNVNKKAFLRTLASISLSPVNQDAILGQDEYWDSSTSSASCYCNGPFKIKDLDSKVGYFTLARNDGYHREEDSKKSVDYFVVPEMIRTIWDLDDTLESEILNMEACYEIMANKAANTIFYMSALSLEDRKDASKATVSDTLSTYSYIFDTENENFNNAQVRNILSQVLDRDYIVSLVTYGKAATGLVSNKVWDSTSKSKSFRKVGGELISTGAELSISNAKSQLNALGVDPGSFTISFKDTEEDLAVATYIKETWEQLGYEIDLKPLSYYTIQVDTGGVDGDGNVIYNEYHISALSYDIEHRDFDVIAVDYQMYTTNALTALAPMSYLYSGEGIDFASYNLSTDKDITNYVRSNIASYKNDAYDELLTSAINEKDLKKRASILHEAEETLLQDMPIMPLYFNQNYYVKSSKLSNLSVNYYGFTVFTRAKLQSYSKYLFED